MALPTATPAPLPSPQVIGNAFVQQYYLVLHRSPELVYRFYQDSSILGRPDSSGTMTSVTTMQAINEKIVSMDFKNYFTEIETADSQMSYQNGVFIVVTGSLTGGDNVRRKFTQSFFLAPQENGGYFVLNDVFRFVNEKPPIEMSQVLTNGTSEDPPRTAITIDEESAAVQEHHVADVAALPSEENIDNGIEVSNSSENGGSVVEEEVAADPPVHVSQNDAQSVSEATAAGQEDAPKKSYASIVKVMKGNPSPAPVYVPTNKVKTAPANTEKIFTAPAPSARAPEIPAPTSNGDVLENSNSHEEEGHSIYIRNLPLNATAEQVEEEFKRFGSIRPGGVQVRSHKIERFCFGFVEFESLKSMQAAIEASPVMIGGRQAFIEEKRTTTRVVNGVVTTSSNGNGGRGRFAAGRGGFQNDNFRGRGAYGGNLGGNLGYRRNEFRNRGEYSARGRVPQARAANGYQQRPFPNVNGRIARPNALKQAAVSA